MEEKKSPMDILISKIQPEKLYTVSEVSAILSLHENTIRTRIREKRENKPRLEYFYDGLYRIPGSAIINYIKKYTFTTA
jgi:predicted transcriptional regulator of viral defense system